MNNYSGSLTWVRGDIGFGGNRMPVSISHIYNSNDAQNNTYGLGYGWRTNFNQRVYLWDQNNNYYVWEDGDGTVHYFLNASSGVYKDEDGLDLTLYTGGSGNTTYRIEDKYGNKAYFDASGRLYSQQSNQATPSSITVTYTTTTGFQISSITDGAGRVYTFSYTNSLLSRISYKGSGSAELSYVAFGYSGSNLTTVTDKDGKSCTYGYGSNNLLTSVTDVDGYKLQYAYNTTDLYKPSSVVSIKEYDGTVLGGELTVAYAHNQTTLTDVSGNVQILQFNNWGNTVSVQDGEGRAQYAQYARDTAASGKANQLNLSSKLQNTVGNRQKFSGFENSTTDLSYPEVSYNATTAQAYYGSKSMRVSTTVANAGLYTGAAVPIQPGETYTLSAYLKVESGSARLALYNGSTFTNGEILSAGTGWTRMQVSYTNTTAAAQEITASLLTPEIGTCYMDCVQLEKAPTASRYNLIEDGDFLHSAFGWTSADGFATASVSAAAAPELETTVYGVKGVPQSTRRATQTVAVSGAAGDTFVVAGWAKGNAVPMTQEDSREFAVLATFHYTDSTTETFAARFNTDVENWQYSASAMVAAKAYSSITVALAYDYNANTVYFDGIQLFKEEFGTSYTYDGNGNLTKVEDLQGQVTTYEYANNDLTKVIQNNKTKLSYTYDSYHNVKTATTLEGLSYTFSYDGYGNNTAVSVGSGLTATAVYTSDGNRLQSTTDAAGNTTTYSYNADTNVLEWVKYPKDTDATKTAYTYDSMYRVASAAATTDTGTALTASYTYTDDLLTKITTGSTEYTLSYGDFALRSNIKIGNRTLASYTYASRTHRLTTLDYGNGDKVQYTYDTQGRITKQTYEDGDTVTYKYDNSGALATVTDSSSGKTTTYYYDLTDRLMKYVESGSGYSHSVGYTYDTLNNLTALVEKVGSTTYTTSYAYDEDNRVTSLTTNGITESYTYDSYGRVTTKVTKNGSTTVLTEQYTYVTTAAGKPTGQVLTCRTISSERDVTYTYSYDSNGNIATVSDGTHTTRYSYDSANQLTREDNQAAGKSWTYTYDDAGNILSKAEYAYTTGTLGTAVSTVSYTYGDSSWGDLLTGYGGKTVTSDTAGNMTGDGTWTYTWEHGRELSSMSSGGTTWSFTYDADGMRTRRTNGSTTYSYVYNGGSLSRMTVGSTTLDFRYDASGTPMTVTYGGTTYYYATNLQGDVVAILDGSGTAVVAYTYDAWGNVLTTTGSLASTLGTHNPSQQYVTLKNILAQRARQRLRNQLFRVFVLTTCRHYVWRLPFLIFWRNYFCRSARHGAGQIDFDGLFYFIMHRL